MDDPIVLSLNCNGPNTRCRHEHHAGRPVHMIPPHSASDDIRGQLVLGTYHFVTVLEGVEMIRNATENAPTPTNDEEWLKWEREHRTFRTIPGLNHPTRR